VRLNRRFGRVWVPKVGWLRFRVSRPVPAGVKSYRVTRDRAGRWHVAFAHIPDPIAGPRDGSVVGIDRGVVVAAALSTGELLYAPRLSRGEAKRLKVLQQRLARAKRGSNRRVRSKMAIAKLNAREKDRRKDWWRRPPLILRDGSRIRSGPDVRAMTRSARGTVEQPGVRRSETWAQPGIKAAAGLLAARLQHKAYGRVEQILAAYVAPMLRRHVTGNRKSQAVFECEPTAGGATPTSTPHATSPPDGR
jgi:putative transposase